MRAPIYVTNEAIEMELGVKKITDIYKKSVLIHVGKMYIQKNTLHNKLMSSAIQHRTQTIRNWRSIMRKVGIADFQDIDDISNGDIEKWKKHTNNYITQQIINNAEQRTKKDREFPTMKLYWELA